jgi:glycosyltransferase involved in cell wall biosynthesis
LEDFMRVGIIAYGLNTGLTGIGRYMVQLARALARLPADLTVVLLTTTTNDRYGLSAEFETYVLPLCRLAPALLTLGNPAVAYAVKRYGLDIIHDPNGIAPFLAPRLGAKRIVTIHDAFAYVHPEMHNRFDNWRYRWHLPYAAGRADAVITNSQHSQSDLVLHLGLPADHVHVTPLGVDCSFTPVSDGPGRAAVLAGYGIKPPYLLYVGSINGRKNVARLFEAYARVRARHPEVTLVVGGKRQWQTAEIDATFRRLDLGDNIHFTGYLDDADLPALYSAAAAFVFPSLYEGFGLPPLEAMACGTPVVTSNVSSLPEVTGEAALLVDPLDVAGLAAAIGRVIDDPALAATLRARGLARAQQFTWERAARETLAIYNQVRLARN